MKVTQSELLSLDKTLRLEMTGLAMAKAGRGVVTDNELASLIDSGIVSAEARIKGLQKFISDNAVIEGAVQ